MRQNEQTKNTINTFSKLISSDKTNDKEKQVLSSIMAILIKYNRNNKHLTN